MKGGDAAAISVLIVIYVGLIVTLWLVSRCAKNRIRREKLTGLLPARRLPVPPGSLNPALTTAVVLFLAFVPVLFWFLSATVARLLTPPAARGFLAPLPPFTRALWWNLNWWLIWAGLGLLSWVVSWLGDRFIRKLVDPVVSRAEERMKAGDTVEAIRELQTAIDVNGPSVERCGALADALMRQGKWTEVLKLSLEIEDRRPLNIENRRRKALALCKVGLPEVALSGHFRSDASKDRRLGELCSYCRVLIDLGLFDRAWDQLRRAEVIYGRGNIPEAERPELRERIDACRASLASHFAEEPAGRSPP